MSDTLVFVPAWNEEQNLPDVLNDLERVLPSADVLVVDDGSTDRTAAVSREHGAEVLSLGRNRGLPVGIAAGYRWAFEHEYAYCGRVDADGQHPAAELSRLLELVRARQVRRRRRFALRVGGRVCALPLPPGPHSPSGHRGAATGDGARAAAAFGDATSGLYAVNAKALPLLAEEFTTEAPEVEALIRIVDAGLRLEEVPVDMAARASGESKLRGGKAVKVVLTVAATLATAKWIQARRSR